MWIQSLWFRLPQIYISYLEPIRISREKNNYNPDADTVYGDTSLQVTQNSCVVHSQILLQLTTCTMASVKHVSHQIYLGKFCMIRV